MGTLVDHWSSSEAASTVLVVITTLLVVVSWSTSSHVATNVMVWQSGSRPHFYLSVFRFQPHRPLGLQSHKSINQMQPVWSLGLFPKVIPPLLFVYWPHKKKLSSAWSLLEMANTTLMACCMCSTLQIIILTAFLLPCVELQCLIFIVLCWAAVLDSLPARKSCCPAVEFSFSLSKMCCSGNLTLPEKTDPAWAS